MKLVIKNNNSKYLMNRAVNDLVAQSQETLRSGSAKFATTRILLHKCLLTLSNHKKAASSAMFPTTEILLRKCLLTLRNYKKPHM